MLSASVGWHIQAGVSTVLRLVCDMLAKREQDGDGIVSVSIPSFPAEVSVLPWIVICYRIILVETT